MYFNDIHILYYVVFAILGLIVGEIIGKFDEKIIDNKTKDKKKNDANTENKKVIKYHYLFMIFTAIIYVFLLYKYGLQKEMINNVELIQYIILTPFLLSVIHIDKELKIIPNRLVLTLFEIGIFFIFIYGIYDINIALNRLVGLLIGAGIFLAITLIGNLISGKETMGYGDVKLIGALGLYFGMTKIMILSITSFLIGAVISIILMIVRRKKMDEYIAFGPFISLASFTLMFIPFNTVLQMLLKIFTLGLYNA